MSNNIRSILTDAKKSKTLSGQILLSNRLGLNPVIHVNGKTIKLVRVSPVSRSLIKKP